MEFQTAIFVALVCLAAAMPDHVHKTSPVRQGKFWQQGRYVQGDMRFTEEQLLNKDAIIGNNYRWPNREVPYQIVGAMDDRERGVFQQAVDDINAKTCLNVVPWSGQGDYITVSTNPDGCWSYIGHLGGAQALNLQVGNPGCLWDVGTPVHELMHAIGFFHEQSRNDRDNFVNIYWDNIDPAMRSQFDLCGGSCTDQGIGYEYGSVMHYDEYAFSSNGQMTMQAKNGEALGNDYGLTGTDAQKINTLYGC